MIADKKVTSTWKKIVKVLKVNGVRVLDFEPTFSFSRMMDSETAVIPFGKVIECTRTQL